MWGTCLQCILIAETAGLQIRDHPGPCSFVSKNQEHTKATLCLFSIVQWWIFKVILEIKSYQENQEDFFKGKSGHALPVFSALQKIFYL